MKHVLEELIPLDQIFLIKSSPIDLSIAQAGATNNKIKEDADNNLPEDQNAPYEQTIIVGSKPFYTQKYLASELSISEKERLNLIHPRSNYYLNAGETFNPHSRMQMFITQYPVLKTFFSDNDDILSYPLYVTDELSASLKLNIHEAFIQSISKKTGLTFIPEQVHAGNVCMAESTGLRPEFKISFSPIHLIDYIYAVAHSNQYFSFNNKIKLVQLMIPIPLDSDIFWAHTEAGAALRKLHLRQSPLLKSHDFMVQNKSGKPVKYPIPSAELRWVPDTGEGNTGRIWVNTDHYFNDISRDLWNFNIGNHYPLRQWHNLLSYNGINGEDVQLFVSVASALKHTNGILHSVEV